jgi:capsid protein
MKNVDTSSYTSARDARVILKWSLSGMEWIDVAKDRDRWRALVNAVMNLWVS